MKIAILYICTGKYSIFWDKLYQSCEQFFFQGEEKHYFVFTDSPSIENSQFIHKNYQPSRGFPLDSLLRFELFQQIKHKLKEFDYIFFCNANMQFVSPVGIEILPNQDQLGLIGTLHPGMYKKKPFWYPYERNKKSTSYVHSRYNRYKYYMGGFNGGAANEYLQLIDKCHENILEDLKSNIIAIYHDESHINRYFIGKKIKELSPAYGYPEDWILPFEPKILIRNKIKHGGKYFDKLPVTSYHKRIKLLLRSIVNGIVWYWG